MISPQFCSVLSPGQGSGLRVKLNPHMKKGTLLLTDDMPPNLPP